MCALLNKLAERKTVDEVMAAFMTTTLGPSDVSAGIMPSRFGTTFGNMVTVDDVTGSAINIGMQTVASHAGVLAMWRGMHKRYKHQARTPRESHVVSDIHFN